MCRLVDLLEQVIAQVTAQNVDRALTKRIPDVIGEFLHVRSAGFQTLKRRTVIGGEKRIVRLMAFGGGNLDDLLIGGGQTAEDFEVGADRQRRTRTAIDAPDKR